jgi:hypothetical protein
MDNTFRTNNIPGIIRMHQLAMKKIFGGTHRDAPMITIYEEDELERGINYWVHISDLNDGDKLELNRILNALLANEENSNKCFLQAKWLARAKGINPYKIFKAGLPYINMKVDA